MSDIPKFEIITMHLQVLHKDGQPTSMSSIYKTKPQSITAVGVARFLLQELKPEHNWTIEREEIPVKIEIKPKRTRFTKQDLYSGMTEEQIKKIEFYTGGDK